jgi:hypothetical protein
VPTGSARAGKGFHGPRLVVADHLGGDAPVLLHRVSDLDETLTELGTRGLRLED